MVARRVDSGGRGLRGVRAVGRGPARRADPPRLKPSLVVVAPNTTKVVRYAGGWLFDRVMAGWDAVCLCEESADKRPLQILGVRTIDPKYVHAPGTRGRPWPEAIAVDAGMCASNTLVQNLVDRALATGTTEVWLWEEAVPAGPTPVRGSVQQHRLSLAARAFKSQALVAAAVSADAVGVAEVFRGGEHPVQPGAPDGVPAA